MCQIVLESAKPAGQPFMTKEATSVVKNQLRAHTGSETPAELKLAPGSFAFDREHIPLFLGSKGKGAPPSSFHATFVVARRFTEKCVYDTLKCMSLGPAIGNSFTLTSLISA